jgi:hypothetical protein
VAPSLVLDSRTREGAEEREKRKEKGGKVNAVGRSRTISLSSFTFSLFSFLFSLTDQAPS